MNGSTYPDGIDCVWIGADRAGHLAAFVTGGIGPIPRLLLDAPGIAVEEIEERISELPRVTGVRLLVSVPRPDDFISMAERGFFVYDWSDVHRTSRESINAYEPMAIPDMPLILDMLPQKFLALVAGIRLDGVKYAEGKAIDVHGQLDCVSGE